MENGEYYYENVHRNCMNIDAAICAGDGIKITMHTTPSYLHLKEELSSCSLLLPFARYADNDLSVSSIQTKHVLIIYHITEMEPQSRIRWLSVTGKVSSQSINIVYNIHSCSDDNRWHLLLIIGLLCKN